MPGPHLDFQLFQCWNDVGGCDLWIGSFFNEEHRWWEGWHSPKHIALWYQTPPNAWNFIGWEKWDYDATMIQESLYVDPNPSLVPKRQWPEQSKQKPGALRHTYDDQGNIAHTEWIAYEDLSPDMLAGCPKGSFLQAFAKGRTGSKKGGVKGKGKGEPKGAKGSEGKKGGVKGKGKGEPKGAKGSEGKKAGVKGMGKDKGKDKGKGKKQ